MTPTAETGQSGIQKARFFLDRLADIEMHEPFDQVAAEAYLEAAIVFGKNTQYVIKKRTSNEKVTKYWNDPICRFVADSRDIIVHDDGSAEVTVKKDVTVFLSAAAIGISGATANATITYRNPTLLQRLRMLWQAPRDKFRAKQQRRREKERMQKLRARLQYKNRPRNERATCPHRFERPRCTSWSRSRTIS